jgi:hypothetical protein
MICYVTANISKDPTALICSPMDRSSRVFQMLVDSEPFKLKRSKLQNLTMKMEAAGSPQR